MLHNPTTTSSEFLTENQVLQQFPVSKYSLRAYRKKGIGPPWVRVAGGRKIFYPARGLASWIRSLSGGGGGAPAPKPDGA